MKIPGLSKLLFLSVALSLSVVACKHNPKSPTPIYNRPVSAPTTITPNGLMDSTGQRLTQDPTNSNPLKQTSEGTSLGDRPGSLENYVQDHDMFKQDTVYFEFDKYNVKASEISKVEAVANYFKTNPTDALLIEGNCDERGTPEYNRALGERRALSVRESLIALGVAGERIHTVSFGEDKPADPGHDEHAWAKNRRGDFVLLKPKNPGQ